MQESALTIMFFKIDDSVVRYLILLMALGLLYWNRNVLFHICKMPSLDLVVNLSYSNGAVHSLKPLWGFYCGFQFSCYLGKLQLLRVRYFWSDIILFFAPVFLFTILLHHKYMGFIFWQEIGSLALYRWKMECDLCFMSGH